MDMDVAPPVPPKLSSHHNHTAQLLWRKFGTMHVSYRNEGACALGDVLHVDGDTVTADADPLAKVSVTAEVLGATKGPKIVIQKYKNKTGYKKRQGHRQKYTQVKITGIEK